MVARIVASIAAAGRGGPPVTAFQKAVAEAL